MWNSKPSVCHFDGAFAEIIKKPSLLNHGNWASSENLTLKLFKVSFKD